jgi:hypothetical protein
MDEVDDPDPQEPVVAEDEVTVHTFRDTEVSAKADPVDQPAETGDITSHSWTCAACGEHVERNFDIYWSCGTAKDGTEDPEFVKVSDVGERGPDPQLRTDPSTQSEPCTKCGSRRIMAGVALADQGQYSDGRLKAVVVGNPLALVFRDQMYGEIRADVCGECGHLELRVENPEDLYEHYLDSLR